jgi:hypothetical protein
VGVRAYDDPVLESIGGLENDVIGIRAIGLFTIADYSAIIEPELERLAAVREQLRLLLYLGADFTGFGEGAWGNLADEIRHTNFHRGAVVTDDGYIRTSINVLKWTLRGDVRTFQNFEYENAVLWVGN